MTNRNTMDDHIFNRDYDLIRDDVYTAFQTFYTWLEIHNYINEDKSIYKKLNENPDFWNFLLHSLQTTFFIALGKIFDDSSDAHSIHKLMSSCVANPELFSKKALSIRKTMNGKRPEWLEEYLSKAFEPTTKDLRALKKSLSPFRNKFDLGYKDIRNQVVAHKILKEEKKISDLFSKTQIKEIEDILHYLYDLLNALWELFHNGREPKLGVQQFDYKNKIQQTTRNVLMSLK
jgi:hypothetical protein